MPLAPRYRLRVMLWLTAPQRLPDGIRLSAGMKERRVIHSVKRRAMCSVCAAVVAAWGAAACGSPPSAAATAIADPVVIMPAAIEAHIRYLADDLLEGREAGTRGYDLAAGYVAAQFRQIGLRPAGNDGGYFQAVPLEAHWVVRDGARLIVRAQGGRVLQLTLGQDYIVQSSPVRATSAVNAGAVFAGYGIDAPVFKHDDYAGLDVKGKVVVLLAGYPSTFPSEEGAHYGSGREKARVAADKGAIGVVTVYTQRYESVYPWDRAVAALDSMSMTWVAPDGKPFVPSPSIAVAAVLSPMAGSLLFEGAPRSYQQVRDEAATGAPTGFPLAVSLELAQSSRHERRSSANVVGRLEGSDPALRSEHVVMLGHLDHEGIGPAVAGDRIYNGAMDNAAGIAGLLEAARALASQPAAPRRSILFLAVTAEEKGLLGSDFFARYPTEPATSLVAAVNLDMPILRYDFTDVIAFGAQHSSLHGIVQTAVAGMKLTLTPDPMPEQAVFTRSDHYRFVQQGVPSIFLSTGWNTPAGAGEGGTVFQQFLAGDYHQPSDDLSKPIDFVAGARFARVNYEILKAIADGERKPTWNDGDFFGNLYATRPR